MPIESNSAYYNMSHKSRGIALIFNHEHFSVSNLKQRSGTQVDRDNLTECLKTLGFQVRVHNNVGYSELYSNVRDVAAMDHTEHDCILIAILSHGEMGIIYSSDTQYKLESVWSHFTADRCPTLAGKPKIFVIQACQGDRLDGGVTLVNPHDRTEVDGTPNIQSYRIPVHADFLIAYSTIPGFYSWRNTTRGSWFIQSLCEELKANGEKYDLLTLLTFVARRVAIDYESNVPNDVVMHRQKQIPCVTSMLTRLIVFPNNKL